MASRFAREIGYKLESAADSVETVRARGTAGRAGAVGRAAAAGLAARYGLDASQPLGAQLAARGVLTRDEGAWLDGAPEG